MNLALAVSSYWQRRSGSQHSRSAKAQQEVSSTQ